MGLRSCGTIHFIQTISGGFVTKLRNINSHGRPDIRFKTLKDVYGSEDAKRLQKPPSGAMFESEQVKLENPYFPVINRTLREVNSEPDEFVPVAAAADVDNELDDETTLLQLKKRFLTRKRKCIRRDESSMQDNANEKQLEDESDLNEPLINLKPKRSKTSKAKRKHMNLTFASSSTIGSTIKSEDILVSESCNQVGGEPTQVIHVKLEVPDAQELGCQNKSSSADGSLVGNNGGLDPHGIASEFEKMALTEYRETLLHAHKEQDCVTNEISYDHLEDVEPIRMFLPWNRMCVKLGTTELGSEELPDLPPLATEKGTEIEDAYFCRRSLSEDSNSDVCSHSRSSSCMRENSEQISSSGTEESDVAIDGTVGCMGLHPEFTSLQAEHKSEPDFPNEQDDSLSSSDKNSDSCLDSIISLKTDESLVSMEDTGTEEQQPSARSFDAVTKNGLECNDHMKDELMKAEEKPTSASPITDTESQLSLKDQTCHNSDPISTPETCQPPERLLSTRKAISPSSRERLRLAMNSVELSDNIDQYIVLECNEELFEKKNRKKGPSVRSDNQYDKLTVNHRQAGQISQQKVIISPKHINRLQGSKGSIEGPRFSRTFPNLSTGCTSIQGCSEGAIAFSQRQMHDMESVATKLMNELKSMKDFVEQKLLFEAYRNVSLKNDADEVKSAIHNATKVEESARKWMSLMARDCNRFCKIMEMTPNSTATSKDNLPKERRKIMFADEAGGKLCHIKFFENGPTSPVSEQ